MSYVADSLVEGEEILYQTTVSYWGYVVNMLIATALLAAAWTLYEQRFPVLAPTFAAGAGLATWFISRIMRNANELAVTDQRVVIKVGWLWQKSAIMYLSRVEGVEVDQSLIGRFLGYGTAQVRGVGTEVFPVRYVINPREFRRAVFKAATAQTKQEGSTESSLQVFSASD
ncbi:MAG: PH domain-containing protein [FCB group bacterium]|jgi:membrane protein YdbS with pleckstrin-like domain|nr:PH domain-containing protein [FCB group bacterium]